VISFSNLEAATEWAPFFCGIAERDVILGESAAIMKISVVLKHGQAYRNAPF
jgi:hypothetical protein